MADVNMRFPKKIKEISDYSDYEMITPIKV